MNNTIEAELASQVTAASQTQSPLKIIAGRSKTFYGNAVQGEQLDISRHSGIIEYQPSELVITARSGTKLTDIEQTLADNNQMLAFEPPMHNNDASYGGAIATGLSGPRRAFTGATRDFVLGTRIINGKGEILQFGGQVMKNVAGYDASRLMAGAQGTLGVLLDISVKVLPKPEQETTLQHDCNESAARELLSNWIQRGLPVSASCHINNTLYIRLSNTENCVQSACKSIGGDVCDDSIWQAIRNQTHDFFKQAQLWRVSIPSASASIASSGPQLHEWAGALRWIVSDKPLYDIAKNFGGHATRYTLHDENITDCFQPLSPGIMALHKRLKHAFDPMHILNPGRLYTTL